MNVSPLNQALADNLAYFMEKKGLKQMALAKKCGIGQTTVSLYLSPERRKQGKDAKPGSAKLTEVEMLAEALEIEPWELIRPVSGAQRELYERFEAAYQSLKPVAPATPAPAPAPAGAKTVSKTKTTAAKKKTEKI